MILVLIEVPPGFERRIRALSPDAQIVFEAELPDAVEEAEIMVGHPHPIHLGRARRLRWLQLASAGADRYIGCIDPGVVLTTASGVYGVPAAEHTMSMMLAIVRALPQAVRSASRTEWTRDVVRTELYGRTCGVLGFGDIGREVAVRARAFGMRVLALKRSPASAEGLADAVFGPHQLHDFLSRCDHIVNTLPLTDETVHLLGASAFASCPRGSYFYNIGRGGTVDEKALVDALQSGRLAGCGLDVFEEEPLPQESPLWSMPNVLITPHVGGESPETSRRVAEIFLENLGRWVADRPLLNRVEHERGY